MHRHRPSARRTLAVALALPIAASACALNGGGRGIPPEGRLITYAQIERTGAQNAWEALERTGTHLQARETGFGKPSELTWRGRTSINLSSAPAVYVDGVQAADFARLREIPLRHIELIRIYNGVQGTKYYGTGGGNGVIAVQTRTTPLEEEES
ncbi:MAG TPA: TonB-dependent receptor plug domain-containing protein [Longimicrobiaceae bacterium]|nr:TonB-dependent receptor plug domain-containing protein [Longimicrobiaceae bacterium]